jgi:hypothetical protein
MQKNILTCACNYSNTLYGSITSSEAFLELFPDVESVVKLYDKDATVSNLKREINILAEKLKKGKSLGILVYNGHGNDRLNQKFSEGFQEYYQLYDGEFDDTEITLTFDFIPNDSLLIVFSDCCSSEREILDKVNGTPFVGNWISFGATRNLEDDMQENLGVLTEAFTMNFEKIKNCSIQEIKLILEEYVSNSWVGDLQHLSIKVSNESLWSIYPFKN